tara:strand:- start:1784 stop:1936 length:153 start_codon:yes stop_codon:yes gene_type:complete
MKCQTPIKDLKPDEQLHVLYNLVKGRVPLEEDDYVALQFILELLVRANPK